MIKNKRREYVLARITNMELENLRELIGAEQLCFEKSRSFAQEVNDPQLRNYLEQKAQSSQQSIQNLTQFLMY